MKKSYLDANILLAITGDREKEGDQHTRAVQIFDDVKSGKIQAVISSLALMEFVFASRRQLSKNESALNGRSNDERIEYVNNESKEMYKKLTDTLLKLPNVKFDIGGNIDLNKLFITALEIMKDIRGKIKLHHFCSKCGANNIRSYNFKSAGVDDILHALMAKNMGCDELITFDKDFDELNNFDEFKSLSIIVRKK